MHVVEVMQASSTLEGLGAATAFHWNVVRLVRKGGRDGGSSLHE
jgi:hypothetical protein